MSDEVELSQRKTAWIRGTTNPKMGRAILTSERLLFFDQKVAGGAAGGVVGVVVADQLQKRHEEGGPLLELPLAAITRISRETKTLSKDRIALGTADAEYLFADGWRDWGPLLRDTLTTRHGRQIVEDTPESWRVQP